MKKTLLGLVMLLMLAALSYGAELTLWHDDLQDASTGTGKPRNYWGCSLAEDGDGYITISVPSNGTFNTMMLPSLRVKAGDVISYQYSGTTAPYNVASQLLIDGTYYNYAGDIVNWANNTIFTKQFVVPATGTLTQVNMKSQYSANEMITYYDYAISRTVAYRWRYDCQALPAGLGNVTLITDGDGYLEYEVTDNNATIGTPVSSPIQVKAGDELRIEYQITQLPGNDSNFQDMYAGFYSNGSWTWVGRSGVGYGGGAITDTYKRVITYDFPSDCVVSQVYFKPGWGYDSPTGVNGRFRIDDFAIVPEPASLLLLGLPLVLNLRRWKK